jgi:hypothetical protein
MRSLEALWFLIFRILFLNNATVCMCVCLCVCVCVCVCVCHQWTRKLALEDAVTIVLKCVPGVNGCPPPWIIGQGLEAQASGRGTLRVATGSLGLSHAVPGGDPPRAIRVSGCHVPSARAFIFLQDALLKQMILVVY